MEHCPLMQRDTVDLRWGPAYLPSCYYFCIIGAFSLKFCKILLKWYPEWLCFWASIFWSCDGGKPLEKPDFKHHRKCAFAKILWSFLDEMISPSLVTGKIFSVQWRGHKISFWVINFIPPNQKKRGLNSWWGAQMSVFSGKPYESKQIRLA